MPSEDDDLFCAEPLRSHDTHNPTAPSPITATFLPRLTFATHGRVMSVPMTSESVSSDADQGVILTDRKG